VKNDYLLLIVQFVELNRYIHYIARNMDYIKVGSQFQCAL
jgi:hypothetical protein